MYVNNHAVQLNNIHAQTDGDFLVVKPNRAAWNAIAPIQAGLNEKMHQEGFKKWVPASHELAHLTLFMGFNKGLSGQERTNLMQRIGKKISKIDNFDLNVKINDESTKLSMLGKYVTLHFEGGKLNLLHEKVKEAVNKALRKNEISPEHINFDKLNANKFTPHFTLGILDVNKNEASNHPEVKKLNSYNVRTRIQNWFNDNKNNGSFNDIRFKLPVKKVHLLGVENINAPAGEKRYLHLAECKLGAPNAMEPIASRNTPLNPKPLDFKAAINNKIDQILGEPSGYIFHHVSFEYMTDHTGQPMIGIAFNYEDDAKRFLQAVDGRPGSKLWEENRKHIVKLGMQRCQNLFGSNGQSIYDSGIKTLSYEKRLKDKLKELTGYNGDVIFIEKDVDQNKKPTVKVSFRCSESVENILKEQLGTAIHYCGERYMSYIWLGEARCKKLFGEIDGQDIYETLSRQS